jgi:hypothetical protein
MAVQLLYNNYLSWLFSYFTTIICHGCSVTLQQLSVVAVQLLCNNYLSWLFSYFATTEIKNIE